MNCAGTVLRRTSLSAHETTPVLQGFAAGCEVVQSGRVEDRGLEPRPSSSGKTPPSQHGNAEFNAFSGDNPKLQLLIERWQTLSHQVQQQIMLLGAGGGGSYSPWGECRIGWFRIGRGLRFGVRRRIGGVYEWNWLSCGIF